ncbi:Competence protein ComM [Phycisphaerales bacterium]|nr:Competence protein ComM [Phycisphaerales bacterium]
MLARVQSYLLQGIDALPCEIELDHDPNYMVPEGGRSVFLVGLPDAGVREAQERVRSALANSGWYFPSGKVVINMAPADVRKEGSVYDLAIAVGLLAVQGVVGRQPARQMANGKSQIANEEDGEGLDYRGLVIAGELALDGRVRPIRGALALTAMAKARGAKGVMVPADNAAEASVVGGIDVYGVRTLAEAVGILTGNLETPPWEAPDVLTLLRTAAAPIDFAEVRGQEGVKRAITIAAAGNHNLFRFGPTVGDGRRPPCLPHGHNPLRLWPSGGNGRGVSACAAWR